MKQIQDLQPGDRIDGGVFAVSDVEHKVVIDFQFITLVLSDCSGKRDASLMPYSRQDYIALLDSHLIRIQGHVQTETKYRGKIKISSFTDEPLPEDLSPFLEPLPASNAAHRERFISLVGSVKEPSLSRLLTFIFDPKQRLLDDFCSAVAAGRMHHAYRGGLLEHTLEVAEMCHALSVVLPGLDRDLLVSCALLHDVGKLEEMEHGLRCGEYTASGALIGHVVSGAHRVGRFADKLPGGFPKRLKDSLMHMMLSHHGTIEFGAARVPAFAEAHVLSQCDMISAQVFQHAEAKASAEGSLTARLAGRKGDRTFVGDLGTEPTTDMLVPPPPVATFVTQLQETPLTVTEPISFTTATPLPVLGLVAAGAPEQSSDEEQETREVVPPPGGADYLLRVTGDSMVGAGINADDLLYVRHQTEAANGDIVVANIAAQGQVVKRLRRTPGDPGIWLDSENPLVDYKPIPFVEGDAIQGKVTGLLREYR